MLTRKAMRLCPYPPPYLFAMQVWRITLQDGMRQQSPVFQTASRTLPSPRQDHWAVLWLIASYMELGREKEARAEARKLLEQHPDFSIEAYTKRIKAGFPFKDYAFLDRQIELLRKAGLPE